MKPGVPVPPAFRGPVFRSPVAVPAFPLLAWEQVGQQLRTDAQPATATFISRAGIFVTAKHVVEDAGAELAALRVLFHHQRRLMPVPIVEWALHPTLDIAVGLAPFPENVAPWCFLIGTGRLAQDDAVFSYGYAEYAAVEHEGATPTTKGLTLSLWPGIRLGVILDYVEPARYAFSADTPGGNSGGPLVRSATGNVHGIISRGANVADPSMAYGIATDLESILDWPIDFLERSSLRQLASRGVVELRTGNTEGGSPAAE